MCWCTDVLQDVYVPALETYCQDKRDLIGNSSYCIVFSCCKIKNMTIVSVFKFSSHGGKTDGGSVQKLSSIGLFVRLISVICSVHTTFKPWKRFGLKYSWTGHLFQRSLPSVDTKLQWWLDSFDDFRQYNPFISWQCCLKPKPIQVHAIC